jgi:hypothetical protein
VRAAQAEKFARDDRIVVLDAGDRLPGYALAVITEELARAPDLEVVIYTDEDTNRTLINGLNARLMRKLGAALLGSAIG